MHPLSPNLTGLSDDELHKKHGELQSRLISASRMGSSDLVMQLQLLLGDYQNEIASRNQKQLEKMEQRSRKSGKGFDDIIDIE